MNQAPFTPPESGKQAFNCPHCFAYARQSWAAMLRGRTLIEGWKIGLCSHCSEITVWRREKMIFPASTPAPPANPDLSDEIRHDYDEAAQIVGQSPRGAAALLRLAIQKLCIELGQKGKNINEDIGALVHAGRLPAKIQKSLDAVRIVGNNAVHPGQLNLNENPETVVKLFGLVNLIADIAITQEKVVDEFFDQVVPEPQREAIEKRDTRS